LVATVLILLFSDSPEHEVFAHAQVRKGAAARPPSGCATVRRCCYFVTLCRNSVHTRATRWRLIK